MEGHSCAPVMAESSHWAAVHFGGAQLGDRRRTKRAVALAAALAENPGMSLPQQLPDWTDLTAAYRFLSNAQVSPAALLAPHVAHVREQAAPHPVVLCVQDSTFLDFTLRTGIQGLGLTGDGQGRGLLQHAALAVLPDKKVLGLLHAAWHAVQKVPTGETRRQRQARWNVANVWTDAAAAIGPWPEGSRLIHVADRQADLFRFLWQATAWHQEFVVRAEHDRHIDDATCRLWGKLAAAAVLGSMDVTVHVQRTKGNQVKRPGRTAHLTIRTAPILVPPPRQDPRTHQCPPLTLWAVYVQEEQPPAGEEAVEWMLLTSLEAATLAQALVIIGYYTCRWVIEEWHRCLKEGCRIEDSQLDHAADIQRLAALQGVLAVRLLQMRDVADDPQTAASPAALAAVVPALFVLLVAGLAKVAPATLTPTLFWRTIARRGGYLGRKHDPRPGWIVVWRGWRDIVQMVRGAELYRKLTPSGRQCV
jgi:hypothetical protein